MPVEYTPAQAKLRLKACHALLRQRRAESETEQDPERMARLGLAITTLEETIAFIREHTAWR